MTASLRMRTNELEKYCRRASDVVLELRVLVKLDGDILIQEGFDEGVK